MERLQSTIKWGSPLHIIFLIAIVAGGISWAAETGQDLPLVIAAVIGLSLIQLALGGGLRRRQIHTNRALR